nr:hypothetical protein [Micromonospora sp. DSM 115978]
VGPAPRPSLWHRLSEPLVKVAFSLAFNGTGADPRIPLAAVQNGSQLVGLLEQFRADYPTISATARVTVNRVYFTARDRAYVTFTIAFDYNGAPNTFGFSGEAVFDRGFWKVSEQTYRSVLGMAGGLPL